MIRASLYRREMKGSLKLLIILGAVMTMYVSIIISMYDPEMAELLDSYVEMMPELMAAVGMTAGAQSLLEFMSSYLYGFILLIFPMLFSILRGNALICRYIEKGSMVYLTAAPVKRRTIAFTQAAVLMSGIVLLLAYTTGLEIGCARYYFPNELDIEKLIFLNLGLLSLQLFISGWCFLASCFFSDAKYSIGVGAGVPVLMYVLQMLANVGGKAEKAKYFTFFTLFQPDGITAMENQALLGAGILLAGAVLLYIAAILVFSRRDLYI